LFPIVEHKPGAVILEMKNLSVEGRLKEVSLRLREGEITGIAGLAGSGKSEIARAVFGLEQISDGQLIYNGERISQPKPAAMLARGIFYVPSDRMAEGLALPRPVRENISVASLDLPAFSARGILRRRKERIEVNRTMERLPIRPRNIELAVHLLSGGNQQKVMLLRGLTRSPRVFLFDDPTVGIDVGAKRDVYFFLKAVAAEGAGVLFISSELPELLNLCSRVYVAHRGQIVAEFLGDEMTEQNVLRSFFEVGEVSSN
jgi:ribose transport system ATP-binding protein